MKLSELPALAAVGLIRVWQAFSALLPPTCRFSPSCSHYGIEALRRHGLGRGMWLTVVRLARCQPWGGSGYDPVPIKFRLFARRPTTGTSEHQE